MKEVWIVAGWIALILFAGFGFFVACAALWFHIEDWWQGKTTMCSRCKSRGLLQKHFCKDCSEKIAKFVGEKW